MHPSCRSSKESILGGKHFPWGERTYVMGIINVAPDSFSGDGIGSDLLAALELAVQFQENGVDIIDVGGESTRPGAAPVSEDVELGRVIPVVECLASKINVPISIDTYKGEVARCAIEAGATIVNDVWGLQRDRAIAQVVAEAGAGLILMHNQLGTTYQNLIPDLLSSLRESIGIAIDSGVEIENIILDPGIGFGKTAEQNLEVLRNLRELRILGRPLLVGTSRKSTIGLVLDLPVEERLEGTAATVAISIANGADIIRVHDVRQMVRVSQMADAIVRGWTPPGE